MLVELPAPSSRLSGRGGSNACESPLRPGMPPRPVAPRHPLKGRKEPDAHREVVIGEPQRLDRALRC